MDGDDFHSDKVSFSGDFVLGEATVAALHPHETGAHFLLRDTIGRAVFDAPVPPGPYDGTTRTGWRVSPRGTAWKFRGDVGNGFGPFTLALRALGV